MEIGWKEVREAAEVLKGRVLRTPLVFSPTLSDMFGARIYLKLENLQKTGSFKVRGATYKLLKRMDALAPGGVVAASAGNHAQGVALAAREAGIPATIVMPEWASISKQEATRKYGGKVVICGQSLVESLEKARELASEGRTFIHPFDDPDIITGQGTLGLEILEDLEHPSCVVVPIGGGGLAAGVASAVKDRSPETRIVGVQAAVCPSAVESLKAGKPFPVRSSQSIADGITVKEIGHLTFDIIRRLVDHVCLVEEEQIAAAILLLLERKKVLAEGAGAVPLGALLSGSLRVFSGESVVLVVSGGNVDSPLLDRILRKGLLKGGRVMRFSVELDDVPGSLARLLGIVADRKANVLHIYHDRSIADLPIHVTRVDLEVETRGFEHMEALVAALRDAGYTVSHPSRA